MKEVGSKEQMERKTGTNDQQLLAECNADFQQQLIVNTTSIQCTIHGEGSIVFTENGFKRVQQCIAILYPAEYIIL